MSQEQKSLLKQRIRDDMTMAMKERQQQRLNVIRLILAALKQLEVDERIELSDERIIATLDKMLKQRRESISQYQAGGREDLVKQEQFEIDIISIYLPTPLTESELDALIKKTMADLSAKSMQDMGKVMNVLKPLIQGRADAALVSKKVKEHLA